MELFLHELTALTVVSVTGSQFRILSPGQAPFVCSSLGVTLGRLLRLSVRFLFLGV